MKIGHVKSYFKSPWSFSRIFQQRCISLFQDEAHGNDILRAQMAEKPVQAQIDTHLLLKCENGVVP